MCFTEGGLATTVTAGIPTTTQSGGVAGGGRQYTFKELEDQIQKVSLLSDLCLPSAFSRIICELVLNYEFACVQREHLNSLEVGIFIPLALFHILHIT